MWFLTCDGDLFGGKRLWLRPGSTHLLGRTSGRADGSERIQYIDHKSVSRKHLIIRVGNVAPGASARLHLRSEITLTDGSKIGTAVNGDKLIQDSRVLVGKEYKIQLGRYEHEFQLRWIPTVISFTSLAKKAQAGEDVLRAQRQSLEQADIKLVLEYVTNETTHVVAKRRNTPPVLQALAQGRWVVVDGFIDHLAAAVYKEGEENSPLEQNFLENWPSEEKFPVPAGNEPGSRPNELMKPKPERAEVFHDYIFVFLTQSQYDLLLPVVTAAGGKAVLWEVHIGQSKSEALIKYINELAGRKGLGNSRFNQQTKKGGVVIVRLNGGEEGWHDFLTNVDIELDQRSIEQNEFLDAILCLDASPLKRQLKEADDDPEASKVSSLAAERIQRKEKTAGKSSDAPTTVQQRLPRSGGTSPPQVNDVEVEISSEGPSIPQPMPHDTVDSLPHGPDAATRRRARRTVTKSRFQGFGDLDPSQISRAASASPSPSLNINQAQGEQSMAVDEVSQHDDPTQHSRKRPPPTPEEDEENMYENMLTGVAAMKRRRTEAIRNGENNLFAESRKDSRTTTVPVPVPKKKPKEIDVLAEVQKRREAEDEMRRKDEEALREGLNGMDISEMKNLAKIEEIEIPVREVRPRRVNGDSQDERWNPAWNGRKNFKKFRPQGEKRSVSHLQRVIVTLEEVSKRGQTINDDYWLTSSSTRTNNKSQSQSQTIRGSSGRSQPAEENSADSERFRRRLENSRVEDADHAVADHVLPEEVAGPARNSDISQTLTAPSQSLAMGNKRPAIQQTLGPPSKKTKISRVTSSSKRQPIIVDDDDDGDALKFRRRRK